MPLIATWNVNSIRARLPLLIAWLKQRNPDIVLLQETKIQDAEFPYELIEDCGYNIAVFGQKSYNGVAILSKLPIEDIKKGFPRDEENDQARYLEAFTCGFRVASIYVPNGQSLESDKFQYKLRFLKRLREHVVELLTYQEAFVLGGDFNVAPTDLDVHDPKAWHEQVLCSTPEREALRAIQFLGLTDSLRALFPATSPEGQQLYTWWDYRSRGWQNNEGLRIDHLLLSPQASDLLNAAGVDKEMRGFEKASDHAPVWCEFKMVEP